MNNEADTRARYMRAGIISTRSPTFVGYQPLSAAELSRRGFFAAAAVRGVPAWERLEQ